MNDRMKILIGFIFLIILALVSIYFYEVTVSLKYFKENSNFSFPHIYEFGNYKFKILDFIVILVNILTKIVANAVVISIGLFCFGIRKFRFLKIFEICLKAEYIFILPIIYEIMHFNFFCLNRTFEHYKNYSALSIINFFDLSKIDDYFIYPLQIINLFELFFILILSYFIGKEINNYRKGFKIVASSYGSALLLWVVVVMFFTLNYS